ncbi:protein of unknown function [Xenorhabdus doucetiae]|uniref:Uncharacterized protein n=1 Tax=Xenorhabdus doucetiae TaxID=351671 RepID=A0A068QPQ0_9GAMM|nr:protein of unknown function [Xenorhabdus doucetiae]
MIVRRKRYQPFSFPAANGDWILNYPPQTYANYLTVRLLILLKFENRLQFPLIFFELALFYLKQGFVINNNVDILFSSGKHIFYYFN